MLVLIAHPDTRVLEGIVFRQQREDTEEPVQQIQTVQNPGRYVVWERAATTPIVVVDAHREKCFITELKRV